MMDRRERRARPTSPVHLYLIAGMWTRRVKIGRASDVHRRWSELQAASGEDLVLYAWAKDCGDFEVPLHEHFAEHRMHGEWFSPCVTAVFASAMPHSEYMPSIHLAEFVKTLVAKDIDERCRRSAAAVRLLDRGSRPGEFEWRGKVRVG